MEAPKLDKHDIKVLRSLCIASPQGVFMKTSSQESRAHDLCKKTFAISEMKKYSMSRGGASVSYRNAYFITVEGAKFLKTLPE